MSDEFAGKMIKVREILGAACPYLVEGFDSTMRERILCLYAGKEELRYTGDYIEIVTYDEIENEKQNS